MVDSEHLARESETMTLPQPRKSKTEHVADTIAARIESGVYPPGSQLPTSPQLRAEFGVSQMVIRLAVDRLKERGLLVSQHGVGVFVKETT